MANHLSVTKSNQIKRLRQEGLSQRQIADVVGVDRKTVRRHLPGEASKGTEAPTGSIGAGDVSAKASGSQCEPFRGTIGELLAAGLHARRIHQDLVAEHGFMRELLQCPPICQNAPK